MDFRKAEYSSLKSEILCRYQNVNMCNNLMYTITIAILAFFFNGSIGSRDPMMLLLPIVIVVPIFIIIRTDILTVYNISSYIQIYYESGKTGIRYESRLYAQSKKPIPDLAMLLPSVVICTMCCLLFLFFHKENPETTRSIWWFIFALLVLITLIKTARKTKRTVDKRMWLG